MLAAAQLVLLSDHQGSILEARGPWAEVAQVPVGGTLASWIADSGSGPALDFLFELRREGAAFGHSLPMSGEPSPALSFAGLMAGEYGWLVAAASERELRAACHELLSSVPDLPHRPARESCELLNRLVTSGGGDLPRVSEAGPLGGSSTIEGGITAIRTAALAAARELLGILAQSGMALFEEPLTSDQARVAAAVARKSEAVVSLLAARASRQPPADVPLAIEPVVEESVALHRTLAAQRKVDLRVELRRPLPRLLLDGAACELWLDSLLGGAVDLAAPGSAVEVVANVDSTPGARTLQLVFSLTTTVEAARGRLAVAKQVAEALGGSLSLSPAGESVEVVARLPAGSG